MEWGTDLGGGPTGGRGGVASVGVSDTKKVPGPLEVRYPSHGRQDVEGVPTVVLLLVGERVHPVEGKRESSVCQGRTRVDPWHFSVLRTRKSPFFFYVHTMSERRRT